MKTQLKLPLVACALVGMTAYGEVMDRPDGIKIGNRMTLRPYVDFSFVLDSNHDQQSTSEAQCYWVINPGLTLAYQAENWSLDIAAFYRYTIYQNYADQLNEHSYGESINYRWSNATANEKGWTLLLNESFQRMTEDDDMQENSGRGLWRDRMTLQVSGVLERRFTDKFHGELQASYYYLDYLNEPENYAALYGWQRWMGGLGLGYAFNQWTDLLITGNYQGYQQQNADDLTGYSTGTSSDSIYSGESQGYTVMAGLGSYATRRISYRVLGGWSRFEYADEKTSDGFVYSVSGNWKITDTWNTMLVAQSQYQPSETAYGTANRVDSICWGLAHSMIRGKLNATFDAVYRRETAMETDDTVYDMDEDIFSMRLGANYTLNRFFAIFANVEYQFCLFNSDDNVDRDYNRFRGTIGVRLQY